MPVDPLHRIVRRLRAGTEDHNVVDIHRYCGTSIGGDRDAILAIDDQPTGRNPGTQDCLRNGGLAKVERPRESHWQHLHSWCDTSPSHVIKTAEPKCNQDVDTDAGQGEHRVHALWEQHVVERALHVALRNDSLLASSALQADGVGNLVEGGIEKERLATRVSNMSRGLPSCFG